MLDGTMGRGRTSFLAGAVLSLVFVVPRAVLAIRVTCEDGGSAVIAGFGRRFASGGTCDIDHSCDGICTFALNVPCMRCRLGRGCPNPDVAAAECLDHTEPPCPSNIRTLAVPAFAARHPARPGRRTVRIGGRRLALTCRPQRACAATTSTTVPPGIQDLSGDWTIIDQVVSADCPPGVAEHFPGPHPLRIEQTGTELRACADGDLPFYDGGAVSPSGFTLATGNCCGVSNGDQLFDFSRTLSGTLPAGAGGIAVTDRWSFSEERGPVTCSRTATGTLVADSVPCAAQKDCTQRDACTRCEAGSCRRIPACRFDPSR